MRAVVPIGLRVLIAISLAKPAEIIPGVTNLTDSTISPLVGADKYDLTNILIGSPMTTDFPSRLKAIRELRGLTQAELGKLALLPSTTISHFESNSRKPSFHNLKRLAKALAVSTDYLMGMTDSPDATTAATRIARHLSNATEEEISMLEAVAKSLADRRPPSDG